MPLDRAAGAPAETGQTEATETGEALPPGFSEWLLDAAKRLRDGQRVVFTQVPATLNEGDRLSIRWVAAPGVQTIVGYCLVPKTKLGGHSRGTQKIVFLPGAAAGEGHVSWRVPWLDGLAGQLVLKGYSGTGGLVHKEVHAFDFRPWRLRELKEDAIYVHLSNTERERLYLQRGGVLVLAALCSGGSKGELRWDSRTRRGLHDIGGWFKVIQKDPRHVSTLDPRWYMPWSLRFFGARHIHGTSPNQYHKLGHPASHGCIRLHRTDAKALYSQVKLGEKVFIY